ncbi:MAG TPA: hypothetical protein VLL54_20180 [Pyrinomonadaceae bacterium]|nr:hypothetical protein [Pyrinomonadaceae bacterium]
MSSPIDHIEFKRQAVQPVECIKAGWELIKGQYWLFVGIVIVGMLVGSVVPLGILMGPMMCGIYLCLLQTRRGQPIEFAMLFKGFDYFGNAVVATLLHMIPIMVVLVPVYIAYIIGMTTIMGTSQNRGGQPDPGVLLGFFGFFGVVWLGIMLLIIILSVVFTFAYPLIVDRGLSGVNAVKLSIRAALANFWRLLGMMLLTGLLTSCGVLLCFVGVYLIVPISFAAIACAYEQVFGLAEPESHLPPPPPSFT